MHILNVTSFNFCSKWIESIFFCRAGLRMMQRCPVVAPHQWCFNLFHLPSEKFRRQGRTERSGGHKHFHSWPVALQMLSYYTVNAAELGLPVGRRHRRILLKERVCLSVPAETTPNQSTPRAGFMRVHKKKKKKIPLSRWKLTHQHLPHLPPAPDMQYTQLE